MPTLIQHADFVESIAAALQYISYYHPADFIAHLARAYDREQSPAAKDAIAQILTNSRMNLEDHPDQPEWLSHVNASVLKVKLATAIIGISSIHLLKTFISAANYTDKVLMWQTLIHIAFLFSALAIAAVDRVMDASKPND